MHAAASGPQKDNFSTAPKRASRDRPIGRRLTQRRPHSPLSFLTPVILLSGGTVWLRRGRDDTPPHASEKC
jgi:hypothetical protein